MSDDVVRRVVAAYAFVDQVIAGGVDLFAMGSHKHILELNRIVLLGASPGRREEYAHHVEATERRFYEERDGGIQDLVEWYERHRGESVWRRAAGVYLRTLTKPQLFIEGNHRTGALLVSYVLARDGEPPFVLTVDNAGAYFDPSTVIRSTAKRGLATLFRLPVLRHRFAEFLRAHADGRFLLPTAPDHA